MFIVKKPISGLFVVLLGALLALTLGSIQVQAQSHSSQKHDSARSSSAPDYAGELDSTFGVGGKVTTGIPGSIEYANAVAVQTDGKIVVGAEIDSHFGLARYNPDGSLDAMFGTEGIVSTAFTQGLSTVQDIAIQPDGKIVAAGNNVGDFALARYNPDGSLDTTFDGDGRVSTSVGGSSDDAKAVLIQPDGKIVAFGDASVPNPGGYDFAVARYNPDGSPDTTFDGDGKVITDFVQSFDQGYDAVLQADGKIVVVGFGLKVGRYMFALARYNSDGSPDKTFDGDGKLLTVYTDAGTERNATASAVAVQADGKIVVGGVVSNPGSDDFAVARYNSNGSLDTTFDTDGWAITDFAGTENYVNDLKVTSDNKIVAVGIADVGAIEDFAVARYNSNGSLDGTFDGDGKLTTDVLGGQDEAIALSVYSDGRMVVAGPSEGPHSWVDLGVVRYTSTGALDATFGSDGKVTTDSLDTTARAEAVAVQPDNKIVAVGAFYSDGPAHNYALARYNPDGSLDTGFGTEGRVTTLYNTSGNTGCFDCEGAFDVAIQPDGKIVAAGTYYSFGDTYMTAARYNPDGTLDSGFADGVTTSSGDDRAKAVAVQPDQKILLGGVLSNTFGLLRLTSSGGFDSGFGVQGRVTTVFPGYSTSPSFSSPGGVQELAVLPDNKILAAGNVYTPTDATFYPALARYNPDGSPDTTFDTDGLVVTTVLTKTIIYAMYVQPDGKILLAGAGGGFLLMRYNSNGSLDTTFDGDGVVLADFPSVQSEGASDLQVLSNGQIVVNGSSSTGTNSLSQFTLARFNSDGSIDTNFGTGGLVTTAFATNAYSRASALQPDGRVVLAGGSNGDFALARYVMTGGAAPSPTATLGTASSPSPTATTGTTPPCTIQFTDVPSTNTFHPFITCLACKGIVSGYPDGTFRYGNNVTRGQISKMVSNSAGFAESPDPQIYEDVPPGSPFYEWVNRLSRRGHMGGYTCGGVNPQTGQAEPCSGDSKPYFRPGNNASRGQVSKIVANGAGFVEAPAGQYFADVPTDNPFYEWVGRLTSRGVMSGYPCGAENPDTGEAEPCDEQERPYFRWANQITRGQTAKIVAGAFFPGCQTPARK